MKIPDSNSVDGTSPYSPMPKSSPYPNIGPSASECLLSIVCGNILTLPQLDSPANANSVVAFLKPIFLCISNSLENSNLSGIQGFLAPFNALFYDFMNNPLNCSADIASFRMLAPNLQDIIDSNPLPPALISNDQMDGLISLLLSMAQSITLDSNGNSTPDQAESVLLLYNVTNSILGLVKSNISPGFSHDGDLAIRDINALLATLVVPYGCLPNPFNYASFAAAVEDIEKQFNNR
jgi:hypothetical protein